MRHLHLHSTLYGQSTTRTNLDITEPTRVLAVMLRHTQNTRIATWATDSKWWRSTQKHQRQQAAVAASAAAYSALAVSTQRINYAYTQSHDTRVRLLYMHHAHASRMNERQESAALFPMIAPQMGKNKFKSLEASKLSENEEKATRELRLCYTATRSWLNNSKSVTNAYVNEFFISLTKQHGKALAVNQS